MFAFVLALFHYHQSAAVIFHTGGTSLTAGSGFVRRALGALAGVAGFGALRTSSARAGFFNDSCADPCPDLQFCWDEIVCGACRIWCFVVWETCVTHRYCVSDIWDLGPC